MALALRYVTPRSSYHGGDLSLGGFLKAPRTCRRAAETLALLLDLGAGLMSQRTGTTVSGRT